MQDNSHNSGSNKPPRQGLRLVHGGVEKPAEETAEAAPERPRRKSALVQFMTAYADSIDRDVKLLLDL